jgi:single-stranded-DNA-specific exonuclease
LKVVAIGTVADVAPLVGENRAIVSLGLADLPNATNPGLRALMEVAGLDGSRPMSASDLGFRIGPRINAAGRMDAARAVVELFEATDEGEARRLAEHLDARNRERQVVQKGITERAVAELESNGECGAVAVVAGLGWHRGVIGLAASKIAERLGRPAVVISLDEDGTGHGSARSAGDYHLLDGLTACADLFESFGGHAQAAGLSIRGERVDELRRRLNEHARSFIPEAGCEPVVEIDAEIKSSALDLALAAEVAKLEPFGAAWQCPVFATRDFRLARDPQVLKGRHFKFHLAGADGREQEALWWGAAENGSATPRAGQGIELAYTVETNTWRGATRLQLIVKDMKKS